MPKKGIVTDEQSEEIYHMKEGKELTDFEIKMNKLSIILIYNVPSSAHNNYEQ